MEELKMKYKVVTYPEGNIVLETVDLAEAINKCSEIDGFIVDENGNDVEY